MQHHQFLFQTPNRRPVVVMDTSYVLQVALQDLKPNKTSGKIDENFVLVKISSPPPQNGMVPHIVHSLHKCIETSLPTAPKDIKLKRFVAQSYIGLFMEEDAVAWFRELMKNFAAEAKRQGEQWEGVYGGQRDKVSRGV